MKRTVAYIDGYNLFYGLLKGTRPITATFRVTCLLNANCQAFRLLPRSLAQKRVPVAPHSLRRD